MHNNFYFLRQLCKELHHPLQDAVISECFSQSREELVIRFETHTVPFFIKANLVPAQSCLQFPGEFQRARKNSIDLFPGIIGRRVIGLRQFENERSFAIELSDNIVVLFKMHGNRSNILFFQEGICREIFKKSLKPDWNIRLENLDRDIDFSYSAFLENQSDLHRLYFTFGKITWMHLEHHGFNGASIERRWELINETLGLLNHPTYYVSLVNHTIALSLLPIGEIRRQHPGAMAAANDFFFESTNTFVFEKEKNEAISRLQASIVSSRNYIEKTQGKLNELKKDGHYKVWADLIMANLHSIPPGSAEVTLENFYNNGKPVNIKLKSLSSPQKTAEVYYRKAKNQQIEIDHLTSAIRNKHEAITRLETLMNNLAKSNDLKSLRLLTKALRSEKSVNDDTSSLPYYEFEHNGYKIWVGKNAESNDTLTLKLGYKEDLWLHAKDVSGSHVLIKHQSGKKFPKDVIERAAELAAYNSKRKTDSLCPVIVTPKKFVRKRKGDPPGLVVVERETVVMVTPKL